MSAPLIVCGLQRTCTNLVKRALVDACDAYQANGEHDGCGWKHAPIDGPLIARPLDGQLQRLIVCVREPFAWMASCYRYFAANRRCDVSVCRAFRPSWSFAQFVRSEHYTWPTPVARWNDYYRVALAVVDDFRAVGRPAAIVRAEDLADDEGQLSEYRRLIDELGLDLRPGNTLRAIGRRVDNRGRITRQRWDPREYAQRATADWTPELRIWAGERLDWTLATRLGY
jgi:hypothetical protein